MGIYIYIIFFLETDYSASEFCLSFQNQTLAQLPQRLGPDPFPAPPTPGRAVPVSARAAGRRRARPAPARPLFIRMAGGNRPFPAGRDRSCQACPALPHSSRVCVPRGVPGWIPLGWRGECPGGIEFPGVGRARPPLAAGPPCPGLGRGSGSSGRPV